MDSVHVEAAKAAAESEGLAPLSFADFPFKGQISTANAFLGVTDSAAAATALATGHKTANGILSMDITGTNSYPTLADAAKGRGMKVGIVTSVSLDHATPAAFYAHSFSRSSYHDIAMQLADSDIDFFGGGGLLEPVGGDGLAADALERARAKGFSVVTTKADFTALAPGAGRVIAISETLDADKSLPYELERVSGQQTLADFVAKGSSLLDGSGGFFMMVEGGKIDWASHARRTDLMIPEVLGLGSAVDQALAFRAAHPDETLIVVTSDHETGGLSSDGGVLSWSTSGHTGVDVGVFALGVGQDLFEGSYPNTGIFDRLKALIEAGASE
jgi:alkaline phosphatase